ncbi:MAG TPA: hypothetical protein VFA49_01095 [Chloroflexota bacterium]|nr:hypothetical protein [Chloroflexota bacterium]
MTELLCALGCGRPAVRVLKNGRSICAPSAAQCPAVRQRNNADSRGKNPWAGRPHPRGMAGKAAWNKGRSLEDLYDRATVERLRASYRRGAQRLNEINQLRRASPELEACRRKKISDTARRVGMGGYRCGSGRGKAGRYRGIWCDSSYELAFVVYALDHGLAFERNWRSFPYVFEGRVRRWIPDFRWNDGLYIEIKGYVTDQVEAKFAQFPHSLLVIGKKNLAFVFEYVVAQYGKDFVRLYEECMDRVAKVP